MTAHINTQQATNVTGGAHVVSMDAARARRAERAYQQSAASAAATTYGQPIEIKQQEVAAVTAVAKRYDNFLDALLPMIMAADRSLSAQGAMVVAEAVMMSPELRGQAESAFAQAHAKG